MASRALQDIEFSHPLVYHHLGLTDNPMAFTSLLALVALAAVSNAAPTAICADGTRVSNRACCAFVPVRTGWLQILMKRL